MSIQKMLEYLFAFDKRELMFLKCIPKFHCIIFTIGCKSINSLLFAVYRILDFRMNNLILERAALKLLKGRVVGTAGLAETSGI